METDWDQALTVWAKEEEHRLRRLQWASDRVCRMILRRDLSDAEIAVAEHQARSLCEALFPDKLWLFDLIYGSRFNRLREQFRHGAPETT